MPWATEGCYVLATPRTVGAMKRSGGGVAAAFGFRYQYLITVDLLLELYANSSSDWSVDVDPVDQDSADIIVRLSTGGPPDRVLQVKASLSSSSTTIGIDETRRILDGLRREHPRARLCEILTNRIKTAELETELEGQDCTLLRQGERFASHQETLHQLTEKLLRTIGRLRTTGDGGTGRELQYLLLRQLIDRVHEAGSNTYNQRLSRDDIRQILTGPNPLLSSALGARVWGKCIQVPVGNYIEREKSSRFLEANLSISSLYDGAPQIAVLKGMSGTGKSAAAYLHARSLLEHVAFVLWLDASSRGVLESQVPLALQELGTATTPTDMPSRDLVDVLSGSPVPWLLVLDGASSFEEVYPWIPRSGYGQVLITTRVATWPDSFAPTTSLDAFDQIEARRFVARRFGQAVESWSTQQLSACDAISRALAGWPLALELAVGWIARHGGLERAMLQFSDRLDRFDLDSEELLPHGYPRTAAQVVLADWRELSPEAQKLASFLLVTGGSRVPRRLLLDALAQIGMTRRAVEDLLSSGFIRQEILTPDRPHDLDDVLTIHGFIQLVMTKQGIPLNGPEIWAILSTSDKWVRQLTEDGRFREGTALIHPIDYFLRQTVEVFKDSPEALTLVSVSMHNFAQLAFITSQATIAHHWSREALQVRQDQLELVRDHATWVQMQLQTLSVVAITAARLHKANEVVEVALFSEAVLQMGNEKALCDPATQHALRMIRDVLHSCLPDSSPRRARNALKVLDALVPPGAPGPAVRGAGNTLLNKLHIERVTALLLMERSAWQAGVDTVLSAANQALEEGALVDQLVDGLLDVGLELMIEASKRPLDTPELLIASAMRLVMWLDENSAALDEANHQNRYAILRAFTEEGSRPLSDVIKKLPPPKHRTRQLDAWAHLAMILRDQRESMRYRKIFSDPPPSVSVTHSIDGGDQLNVWWRDTGPATPELWVHAPGIVTVSSSGRIDPVRQGMERAGLLEVAHDEPPQPTPGWLARLTNGGIKIFDAKGTPWVTVEDIPPQIVKQICAHGGLTLIYADLAITHSTDPRLSGWISLATGNNQLCADNQNLSKPWWRKLFGWLF